MANKNTKFRTMYTEIGTKEGKTKLQLMNAEILMRTTQSSALQSERILNLAKTETEYKSQNKLKSEAKNLDVETVIKEKQAQWFEPKVIGTAIGTLLMMGIPLARINKMPAKQIIEQAKLIQPISRKIQL